LMELALDDAKVPYVVLSVGHADKMVGVRFSSTVTDHLNLEKDDLQHLRQHHARKQPEGFALEVGGQLAIVFKLHGCLYPEDPSQPPVDSIVLSDDDYIRFLMRMQESHAMIPGEVTRLLEQPGFLFLGYSFSDWNVRAIYRTVLKSRPASVVDYAVVRDHNVFESRFSDESRPSPERPNASPIELLITDLNRFSQGIRAAAGHGD
jgi:hypothetical protein